ncbi:receptor-type protein kinase, putative [Bodo saltans]|uniref:Receptor-type protein kinase, putative n=1 Tax=Bodo saltans TaxID=75058 RepID=A0A0S4J047_BODSA|nr:receptor-type protein kinase, putative [Bodo saltans]|eukprot:CUG32603.1 receptor-type protein kinase, putative [Bodo saltans]
MAPCDDPGRGGAMPSDKGVLEIVVRRVSTTKKSYPYHARLCVGIMGTERLMYLPLALGSSSSATAVPTSSAVPPSQQTNSGVAATTPPSWWNSATSDIVVPSNSTVQWVLDEEQSVDYIELRTKSPSQHHNEERAESHATVLFQFQKVKTNVAGAKQYAPQLYPAEVALPASSKSVEASLQFGKTSTVVIKIRRLETSEIEVLRRSDGKPFENMTRGITTLANTLALLSSTARTALEGSRAHRLLSEWTAALHGVGEQLAPLVEALPFGGIFVKAAAGLFAAILSRGVVQEVGADVCSQTALMLRVLAQPLVQKMILADPTTQGVLEKLVMIMEDTVRLLQQHQTEGRVRQLWDSSRRLSALESNSSEMRAIFTTLHQLTSFRAMSNQHAADVKEDVSVVRATSLLTAADLSSHLLPQLVELLHKQSERSRQASPAGVTSHTDMSIAVEQMRAELRNDLNELISSMFTDLSAVVLMTGNKSVEQSVEMITETLTAVVASSPATTIATMSATMRTLIEESMTNVLPQAVRKAMDESLCANLDACEASLSTAVATAWTSALQREIHNAVDHVQAHTKQTVEAIEVHICDALHTKLGARLDAIAASAHKAMDCLDSRMKEALDAQTKDMFEVVREGAVSVRSLVEKTSLSSLERIAVLHACVTDVASELTLQKKVLERMSLVLDAMYNADGTIRSDQAEVTAVVKEIPAKIQRVLAPEIEQLCKQLRFHEGRSKSFVKTLLDSQVRRVIASYAALESTQRKDRRDMTRLVQRVEDNILSAFQRGNAAIMEKLDQMASPSGNTFQFDAADDDGHQLPPEEREYNAQIPLEVLQAELRCWYGDLHALETSAVANVELNRMSLFASLRIVRSVKSAHRADAADDFDGASMESTEVIAVMDSEKSRFLLVEGRAGIGKTTWAIHLAQLQNYANGIVMFLRLSELAAYFEGKPKGCRSLSLRELMYVSLGADDMQIASVTERIKLVNRAYFFARGSGKKIVWLVDGLDEVLTNRNPHLETVLNALNAAAAASSERPSMLGLFGANDVIVVTSREERGGVLPSAQFVATINPWTIDEAVGYVRNYYGQQTVQAHIDLESGGAVSIRDCVVRASEAVRKQSFGSFSTLPIVLEMLCLCMASSTQPIGSVSELYRRTIAMKVDAARKKLPTLWKSTESEIVAFCKALSHDTTVDGIFFTIDALASISDDLLRSGLVRARLGATRATMTVRFVHKSFLEYFQALYFSENLAELPTTLRDCTISTSLSADGNVAWRQHVSCSIEDVICTVSPRDSVTLDLELQVCRSMLSDIDVVLLSGEREMAMFVSRKTIPSSAAIHCRWRHRSGTEGKIFSRIELQRDERYYLMLRPAFGSAIVPVRCKWIGAGAHRLIITQKLPLCDIPGHRQQRNFFQMLTDITDKSDEKKGQQLLGYLMRRLEYHHPRLASSMDSSVRGLAASSTEWIGEREQSKAHQLSDAGLSIVVECANVLLKDHSKFGDLLSSVSEGTSFVGTLLEAVGARKKAIYEWALLPVARYGTLAMWKSLEQRISKNSMNALLLDGAALQEVFVAAMVHGRHTITSELERRGVKRNFILACRLGASSVVLQEIKETVSSNISSEIDEKCYRALVESLSASQHSTAQVVWEELASIMHATPKVWSLMFSSFSEATPTAGLMSKEITRKWLQSRCRGLVQHLPPSISSRLKEYVKHAFPSRYVEDAFSCGLLERRWFTDACDDYFSALQCFNKLMGWATSSPLIPPSGHVGAALRLSGTRASCLVAVSTIAALERALTPTIGDAFTNVEAPSPTLLLDDALAQRALVVLLKMQCCQYTPAIVSTLAGVLHALRLFIASRFVNIVAGTVLSRCTDALQIRYVDYSYCRSLNSSTIRQIALLKDVQHLTLHACQTVRDTDIMVVASLTQLQHLDLSYCGNITDAEVLSVASLTKLQHLDLRDCRSITDAGVRNIALLTQLQHLDLSYCGNITDAGAASIASLKQLQYLDLSSCGEITDAGVASIASLTQLQYLDLSSCGNITDAGVRSIASLTQLQHLVLSYCGSITDAGVQSIASLTQLRHLDLSGCKVTDAGVWSIASLVQLRHLVLSYCVSITDAGVQSIASLTQLQHLDLSCCKVTDAGVASIASLTQLQHLALNYCRSQHHGCWGAEYCVADAAAAP